MKANEKKKKRFSALTTTRKNSEEEGRRIFVIFLPQEQIKKNLRMSASVNLVWQCAANVRGSNL